ncbi:DUF4169 family protein [Brevundimonas subvibrioides]|uniref:DUF4169 family protein n=1 Tax=Brevundimonas subvibrioides TaxID=74313 RepID=UPI0022B3A2FB|nr:DUF4169 family protein [Brevundimonas subvibrioides]
MAEIVNLNRARKARNKAETKSRAEVNRVLHGLTRAERDAARAERERLSRLLDQSRLED